MEMSIKHDCKQPEFCPACDRMDEAMEQAYGFGHSEQLFRGDDTLYGREGKRVTDDPQDHAVKLTVSESPPLRAALHF